MPVYSLRRWWVLHRRNRHESDYCLPSTKPHSGRLRKAGWPRRRACNILILALLVLLGWSYILVVRSLARDSRKKGPFVEKLLNLVLPEEGTRPPLYERYREAELELSKRAGDSPQTKYVFFADHMERAGWGNIMQELILHAHTAYRLNRTFVWYDYEWNPDGSQYTFYNGKRMPSRIPLSAFVQGVLVGAQPRTDDNAVAPIGVAEGYFDAVCPKHTRQQVTVEDIFALIGHEPTTASLLEKTLEVISPMPEKCVEVRSMLFNIYLFGDGHRLLDDWAALSKSPILQEFFWSSLVESAFDWNRKVFSSVPDEIPQLGTAPLYSYSYNASPSASRYIPISGLLALHIRLGDFEKHCTGLAKWRSSYVGFNSFPELPDHFAPPSDSSEAERIAQYRPRCLVSVADVVRRVREVREVEWAAGRELRDVYLMTNAPEEWIAEAKATLRDMDGPQWRSIASSRDLVVSPEQEYVAQAVDMLVGQRAQVFVGNGFSSLSGLITMFRMANGVPPNQTRFF